MSDDLFTIAVPDAELEAPAYTPMPTGAYRTTLQKGTELATSKTGPWLGLRVPFAGFYNTKTGQEFTRPLRAQFTYGFATNGTPLTSGQQKSVDIGLRAIIGVAAALKLTEPTQTADGKAGQKLTAANMDELVEQFNAMAGTEVEVYLTAGPRERNGAIVLKDDGTPFLDNEIKNVRAVKS